MQAGEVLVSVPREMVLSVEHESVKHSFPQLQELADWQVLALVLLHKAAPAQAQQQQHDESALGLWREYHRSLLPVPQAPALWSEQELAHLKGTSIEESIQEQRETLRTEFEQTIKPLLAGDARFPSTITADDYLVRCLVLTRMLVLHRSCDQTSVWHVVYSCLIDNANNNRVPAAKSCAMLPVMESRCS